MKRNSMTKWQEHAYPQEIERYRELERIADDTFRERYNIRKRAGHRGRKKEGKAK